MTVESTREVRPSRMVAALVVVACTLAALSHTAEGVETLQQVAELQELGCEQAQGFHYARPLELSILRDQVTDLVVGASR